MNIVVVVVVVVLIVVFIGIMTCGSGGSCIGSCSCCIDYGGSDESGRYIESGNN